MAKAYVDPDSLCCVEEAKRRMTPEDFKESYPELFNYNGTPNDMYECGNTDLNLNKYKSRSMKQRIMEQLYGKRPGGSNNLGTANPKASVYVTRSGSSIMYTCKNHANLARQRGSSMERYLQYMRPDLNEGESIKVASRFEARKNQKKAEAISSATKIMNQALIQKNLQRNKQLSPSNAQTKKMGPEDLFDIQNKELPEYKEKKAEEYAPTAEAPGDLLEKAMPVDEEGTTRLEHDAPAPDIDYGIAPTSKMFVPMPTQGDVSTGEDVDSTVEPPKNTEVKNTPKETPVPETPAPESAPQSNPNDLFSDIDYSQLELE